VSISTDVDRFYQFRVRLLKDKATGQIVAEVPALDISDYGLDSQKALRRLKEMVTFHLECLVAEGKPVPSEKKDGEGFYLKVRYPTSVP
jgi:predicted RNase H-like HicB family nuclease